MQLVENGHHKLYDDTENLINNEEIRNNFLIKIPLVFHISTLLIIIINKY